MSTSRKSPRKVRRPRWKPKNPTKRKTQKKMKKLARLNEEKIPSDSIKNGQLTIF